MKIITDKEVNISAPGTGAVSSKLVSYRELIVQCLASTGPQGMGYEEIKKRDRIYTRCQDKDKDIKLEDADYEHLVGLVREMKWAVFSPEILEFCDYIIKLKDNK
jgi:hypothetical protein